MSLVLVKKIIKALPVQHIAQKIAAAMDIVLLD